MSTIITPKYATLDKAIKCTFQTAFITSYIEPQWSTKFFPIDTAIRGAVEQTVYTTLKCSQWRSHCPTVY